MLDLAFKMTRCILPDDGSSPSLAQLNYLLHDLGELKTVGELLQPGYTLVFRHEFATIEPMEMHRTGLEQRTGELAVALRYLVAYLSTPAAAGEVPELTASLAISTLPSGA